MEGVKLQLGFPSSWQVFEYVYVYYYYFTTTTTNYTIAKDTHIGSCIRCSTYYPAHMA